MNLCEKWKWIFLHIHERIESWVCDCDSNLQQDKIHFSSSIIILTIRNDRMVNFFIETITIIPYFAQDAISSCFSLLWIIIIYLQVPRHQFPKIDLIISTSPHFIHLRSRNRAIIHLSSRSSLCYSDHNRTRARIRSHHNSKQRLVILRT